MFNKKILLILLIFSLSNPEAYSFDKDAKKEGFCLTLKDGIKSIIYDVDKEYCERITPEYDIARFELYQGEEADPMLMEKSRGCATYNCNNIVAGGRCRRPDGSYVYTCVCDYSKDCN